MPGRKPLMQYWDSEAVSFMRDAMAYCGYAEKLADVLLPYLPKDGHICDAGCGIGTLAIALAKRCRLVTAVDVSQAAIHELKQNSRAENLHAICADIFTMQPKKPYDAMVFCYFGRMGEILRIAKRQCAGRAVIVKRNCSAHRFSIGEVEQPLYQREKARELLEAEHIPYIAKRLSLELGQPFRNMDDALAFFSLYNRSELPVTEESVAKRLCPTQDAQFPLYLPEQRQMEIFVLQAEDIPPAYGADTDAG